MIKKELLLSPGPTTVPADVLLAMAEPLFHHRTPRYQALFKEVCQDLKLVFRTQNDVYTLTSSGTGAMEASFVNFLSPGDRIVVVDGGKFGERFSDLAKAFHIAVDVIKIPYGKSVDPQEVEQKMKAAKIAAVYTTLCETSTGALHDIEAIGKIVAKTDAILVCDAISGLGADRLETDAWGVDVVVSGSQKGLMLPPGLAFISVSPKAWKKAAQATLPKFYFDLTIYKESLKSWDTPWTPATTLVVGLKQALTRIKEEGWEEVLRRHAALAEATRAAMKAISLELFANHPANTVTAVKVPQGVDGEKLVKIIRDEIGITLAGGQGSEMKGKIFRFGHLGYCSEFDLVSGLAALEQVLAKLNYKFELGAGLKAFQQAIQKTSMTKVKV